jgi:ABC-2 type transport system permease protein
LSLPATFVTLFAGSLILQFPLQIHPLIVVVVPLISLSLCGLGALIGLVTRTPEQAGSLSLVASLFLFGFGPVLIPLERLPAFMQTVSLLSPTTYAASALRQVVLGQADRLPLGVNLLVLSMLTVALLWFINQRLDWREKV